MLHLDTFGAKYVPLWNSFCGGPYHTVIIAWFPWRACQLSHELQNRTPAMTARTGCYSSVFPQYLVQCLTQNIYNVVFTDEWITASLIGVACLHSPRSTLLQRFMASHKPYLLLSTYLQNEGNAPIVSWHESFQLTRLRQIHLPNTRCGWTALAAVIIGLLGAVVGMRDVKTERLKLARRPSLFSDVYLAVSHPDTVLGTSDRDIKRCGPWVEGTHKWTPEEEN